MFAVLESKFRIKLLGARVVAGYFQMYGVNLERLRALLDEFYRLASPAVSAMTFEEKEFIDEGIAPQQFQTLTKGKHDVPDDVFSGADEPDAAESRVAQQARQSAARFVTVKRVMIEGVIFLHHREQHIGVRLGSDAEGRFHAIRRRARLPAPYLDRRSCTASQLRVWLCASASHAAA